MPELCFTIILSVVIYSLAKIAIKVLELKYLDRKNEKEGKYIYIKGGDHKISLRAAG